MLYQTIGKSSLRVSRISFGCMSLEENITNVTQLIHQAIETGINLFDTADLYQKGINEEMLGKSLKEKRKDLVIATKVGNQWRSDGSGWDWNPTKKYILQAVEKSLQRLQTDYIDLYQLHGGTLEDPIDETIEAFELLKQQGKIRYYGISSIRPQVIKEYVKRSNIVSVMMQYSLLDRRPEQECLELLRQHDIGVLARGSLAKGLLAGKPATEYLNYGVDEVKKAADAIKKVANDHRATSQAAIHFVLHHPAITTAVVGIRTAQQLAEAVFTFDTPPLANYEQKLLEESIPPNFYK